MATTPTPSADFAIEGQVKAGVLKVDLLGTRYEIRPPKAGMAMNLARMAGKKNADPMKLMDLMEKWIDHAFHEKSEEVKERIFEDPDDDLDFVHIIELVQKITELQTGSPTT